MFLFEWVTIGCTRYYDIERSCGRWDKCCGRSSIFTQKSYSIGMNYVFRVTAPGLDLCSMPKKFVGENSKAVVAKQRKEDVKQEKEKKQKQIAEDAAWQDDDKQLVKKQQKKEEQERKRQQQLDKKAEAKALLEKEQEAIKPLPKVAPPAKITRAHIQQVKEKTAAPTKPVSSRVSVEELPLEENLNRIQLDGEVAQSIDEAITVLSDSTSEADRHPEKRMKAAYTSFEEATMPILKAENPTLRLSQLKQLLRKEWLKSPQNPLNQKY